MLVIISCDVADLNRNRYNDSSYSDDDNTEDSRIIIWLVN